MTAVARLVEASWLFHRLSVGDRAERLRSDDFVWAMLEVYSVVDDAPADTAVQLLDALLHAPDADPAVIGAGLLEDALHERTDDLAVKVAAIAAPDARWCEALAHVYLDNAQRRHLPVELRIYLSGE